VWSELNQLKLRKAHWMRPETSLWQMKTLESQISEAMETPDLLQEEMTPWRFAMRTVEKAWTSITW
jgi:hypothetical protein